MKKWPCKICGKQLTGLDVQCDIIMNSVEYPACVPCADSWAASMVTVYKVSLEGHASYYEEHPGGVADLLQNADDGAVITIKKTTMNRAKYETLPEFEGF